MKKDEDDGCGYRVFNKNTPWKSSFFQLSFLSSLGCCWFTLTCLSLQLYGQPPVKEWDKTIDRPLQRLKENNVRALSTLSTQLSIRANTGPRQAGSIRFDLPEQ